MLIIIRKTLGGGSGGQSRVLRVSGGAVKGASTRQELGLQHLLSS